MIQAGKMMTISTEANLTAVVYLTLKVEYTKGWLKNCTINPTLRACQGTVWLMPFRKSDNTKFPNPCVYRKCKIVCDPNRNKEYNTLNN